MTRRWGPAIKAIQDAIAQALRDQRDANAGSLPTPLQGEDFEVVGSLNRDSSELLPTGMRVFPPENSAIDAEVTNGFEGVLQFPIAIHVKSLADKDVLELLTEAVGLVVDAVAADPTFGGLTGGTASPGIQLGGIDVGGGEAIQEVLLRLHVRQDGS